MLDEMSEKQSAVPKFQIQQILMEIQLSSPEELNRSLECGMQAPTMSAANNNNWNMLDSARSSDYAVLPAASFCNFNPHSTSQHLFTQPVTYMRKCQVMSRQTVMRILGLQPEFMTPSTSANASILSASCSKSTSRKRRQSDLDAQYSKSMESLQQLIKSHSTRDLSLESSCSYLNKTGMFCETSFIIFWRRIVTATK